MLWQEISYDRKPAHKLGGTSVAHPEYAESQEKLPYAKHCVLVLARERARDPSAFSRSSSWKGRCRSDALRLVT